MNPISIFIILGCAIGVFAAQRKWAWVPILIGVCYITTGQKLQLGSVNIELYQILVLVAYVRVAARGEFNIGGLNIIDKMMIWWAVWTLFASFFHEFEPGSGPQYALKTILSLTGFYFLVRIFFHETDVLLKSLGVLCLILLPVAAEMVFEQVANRNLFSIQGGVPEHPFVRNGRLRAQGPFNHPILAGTIGACCFPLAMALWHTHRSRAILGMGACVLMVFASASSGPLMAIIFATCAIYMWKFRQHCGTLQKLAIAFYILLIFAMDQPPYYIIARIDLTGSSTGWHRAFLIERTIMHLNEWWLFGTDRTVHWMPLQGRISAKHTDVTNYYISFGVLSGLPSIALVVAMIWKAFKKVGEYARSETMNQINKFAIWCLGASLFANAASSLSVAYFGQSLVFFWMPIAIIASLYNGASNLEEEVSRTT